MVAALMRAPQPRPCFGWRYGSARRPGRTLRRSAPTLPVSPAAGAAAVAYAANCAPWTGMLQCSIRCHFGYRCATAKMPPGGKAIRWSKRPPLNAHGRPSGRPRARLGNRASGRT